MSINIDYAPIKKRFMYLTVIIDVCSRYIVGWQVSRTTWKKETQTELLIQAVEMYGVPEIVNSDQGSQYMCGHWIDTLINYRIRISMDGKEHATDKNFIEQWFRTIKQKHITLNPVSYGLELYQGIKLRKPIDLYLNAT